MTAGKIAGAGATRKKCVLVVDDQKSMASMLADGLAEHGYDVVATASSEEASALLAEDRFDALVTDLRMPIVDGIELLERSKRSWPGRPVIIMTAYSAVDSAVDSIRRGAYHYLTKPFKVDELVLFLERAIDEAEIREEARTLRRALHQRTGFDHLVGASRAMQDVFDLARRLAKNDAPVLILGETGTGKGVVARAIHASGSRSGPFVTVGCATLPENLLESELFGHVKGAFTGATAHRVGLFEEADRGTIFLDEIGELPRTLQAKLLDVLERGVVRAVGSNKEKSIDVRVIAATHRDLRGLVLSGDFREDLFYRLEVLTVELPPLRARSEDIPMLVAHFLQSCRAKNPEARVVGFSKEAMDRLIAHAWPGNVRELEHVVQRAVLLGRSEEVGASELPVAVGSSGSAIDFGSVVPLREMQRRYVTWAYERLGSKKLVTAERLGIDDKTLARWLAREPDDDT